MLLQAEIPRISHPLVECVLDRVVVSFSTARTISLTVPGLSYCFFVLPVVFDRRSGMMTGQ